VDLQSCSIGQASSRKFIVDLRIGSEGEVYGAKVMKGLSSSSSVGGCLENALSNQVYPAQGDGRCFYRVDGEFVRD
jgi:hypothetical protein